MLTARALWMVRRNTGLDAGSVPPAFTAMVMSLAIRANCFAMRFHRANIVCFLTSNMRPMGVNGARSRGSAPIGKGEPTGDVVGAHDEDRATATQAGYALRRPAGNVRFLR